MKGGKKSSQKVIFIKKDFQLPKTTVKFRSSNAAPRLEHRRVGE